MPYSESRDHGCKDSCFMREDMKPGELSGVKGSVTIAVLTNEWGALQGNILQQEHKR